MTLIANPSRPTFKIGDTLKFEYPKWNDVSNIDPTYVPRIIRVKDIRDLSRKSLHPITVATNATDTSESGHVGQSNWLKRRHGNDDASW